MSKTLVLITDYFPYGTAETFLETEIKYLSEAFEKVIICPGKRADDLRNVPGNVEISAVFCQPAPKGKFHLYFSGFVFIIHQLPLLLRLGFFRNFSLIATIKSIKYSGLIAVSMKKINGFLQQRNFDFSTTLFYTYWFGYETLALGLLKNRTKSIKVVSRAHGYDLYNERGEKSLNFIKPLNLQLVDKIFCISGHGLNYLAAQYPYSKEKLLLSYLGSKGPGLSIQPNDHSTFKMVSCSGITPVKRLDKIIELLFYSAQQNIPVKLEWHHMGDGPLKIETDAMAKEKLTGKVDYFFYGNVNNKEIFQYYQKINPNLFINLSDSEGLPVSIMEAMSVGIPVMATNVGGTSEIVNNDTGWLVDANAPVEFLSTLLCKIAIHVDTMERGKKAMWYWNQKFNADKNYRHFTNQLKTL